MLLTQDHGRERWREMEEDDNEDDCLDSNNTLNEEGHDIIKMKLLRLWKFTKWSILNCKHFTAKHVNLKWAWEGCHAVQPSP